MFHAGDESPHGNAHNAHPQLPPLPPPPPAQTPRICQLLLQEAYGWNALLQLHGGLMNVAQTLTPLTPGAEPYELVSNGHASATTIGDAADGADASANAQRELQYCTALTQIACSCDQLHQEAQRLRNLRKMRASVEEASMRALQTHTNESLAVGSSTASSMNLSLQSSAVALRTLVQQMRSDTAQLRALLQLLETTPEFPLELAVSVRRPGSAAREFTPSVLFDAIYRNHTELTDDSLITTLVALLDFGEEYPLPGAAASTAASSALSPTSLSGQKIVQRRSERAFTR